MHIHPNQINPAVQLDALRSTEKAAANAAAARTRKKLTESASELAGEAASEAFVVEVESQENPDEENPRRQKNQNSGGKAAETQDLEADNHSVSDWA
jgi:hypothetical protein